MENFPPYFSNISAHDGDCCHLCDQTFGSNCAVKLSCDVPMPQSQLSVCVLTYKFGFNISVHCPGSLSTIVVCLQCHESLQEIDKLFNKLTNVVSDLKVKWPTDTHVNESALYSWLVHQPFFIQENANLNENIMNKSKLVVKKSKTNSIVKKLQYSCDACFFEFQSAIDFKIHMKSTHEVVGVAALRGVQALGVTAFFIEDIHKQFFNNNSETSNLDSVKFRKTCVSCKVCISDIYDYLLHLQEKHKLPDLSDISKNNDVLPIEWSSTSNQSVRSKAIKQNIYLLNVKTEKADLDTDQTVTAALPKKCKKAQWMCKECHLYFKFGAELDDHITNCQHPLNLIKKVKRPDGHECYKVASSSCMECDLKFSNKEDYQVHQMHVHPDLKVVRSSSVNVTDIEKFKGLNFVHYAMVFASHKEQKGHMCKEKFSDSFTCESKLDNKITSTLIRRKPLEMSTKLSLKSKAALQSKRKRNNEEITKASMTLTEQKYHCYLCKLDFQLSHELKKHYMNIHHDCKTDDEDSWLEKKIKEDIFEPNQCNMCGNDLLDAGMTKETAESHFSLHGLSGTALEIYQLETPKKDTHTYNMCSQNSKMNDTTVLHIPPAADQEIIKLQTEQSTLPNNSVDENKQHGTATQTSEDIKCISCDVNFKTSELNEHYASRHSATKCTEPIFNKANEFSKKRRNGKCSIFKCVQCTFQCFSLKRLELHKHSEHGVTQSRHQSCLCKYCGKLYSNAASLHYHIANIHENKREFVCKYCDLKLNTRSILVEHMKNNHSGNVYRCEKCDLEFPKRTALYYHLCHIHREKTFKCPTCNKAFTMQGRLTDHQRKLHGTGPLGHKQNKHHQCSYCSKVYSFSSALRYHLVRQHSVPYLQTLSRHYYRNHRESNLRNFPISKKLADLVDINTEFDPIQCSTEKNLDLGKGVSASDSEFVEILPDWQLENLTYLNENKEFAVIEVTEELTDCNTLFLNIHS